MTAQLSTRLALVLWPSRVAGPAVVALATLVLAGWLADVSALKSLFPGLPTMKANTALAVLALGVALELLRREPPTSLQRRIGQACIAFAALLAALTLGEYLLGTDLGIDQSLFADATAQAGPAFPGRMSPATAFTLLLLGTALLLLDSRLGLYAQFLAIASLAITLSALTGYLYGVSSLYRIGAYDAMALPTTLAFLLLGAGLLCARPGRGLMAILTSPSAGGVVARRLLPMAVAVPFGLGALLLAGQRGGLYDNEFGIVLFALTNVVVFSALILWSADYLHRTDAERQLAESALRESEALFRGAFDDTNVAMVLTDLNHRFVRVNAAFAQLFGYSVQEMLRLSMPEITHPDDLAESYARRSALHAGEISHFLMEKRYLHKDGHVLWGLASVSLVRSAAGEPLLYVGQVQDVTQRKRAEVAEKLLAAERDQLVARLELQIERMPLGYLLTGPDLRYTHWSPAAERIFGFTRDEVLGKHPFDVIVPPQSRGQVEEVFQRLAGGDMRAHGSCENVTKDGRIIVCEWHNTPLHDPDGTFAGVLSMAQDVTNQRRLEEQFRQSQKMEAVGRLAGGVAHDFNNLLTAIIGFSDIALNQLAPTDALRDIIEQIQMAGERAAALTRQLLAFSRKQLLVPIILDLNGLLADMEKMLARVIGEDIDLSLRPTPDLWRVKVDAGQMEQVLMNLVVNARDAMPTGGKLTIETANVELDEGYLGAHPEARAGEHVMVAVSDNGCGMDSATQARIFEPFFTTKGPDKGSGLGLATVYGIVKQSGGHIEVYSEPGLGSSFKIYLPREREGAPEVRASVGPREVPCGSETVLLAEDEDGVRALTKLVLQKNGYKVLEATDGAEAVRACEEHKGIIHLLVTDVVMPNLSGREVAERVRAMRPELKVLYLSGYTDDAVIRHGVVDDEAPFLHKPFAPDALARKVREVLDG